MDRFPSSTPAPETPSRASPPKALWGVIGALAVAVAALGGTLLYQQGGRNAGAPPTAATQPFYAPDDGTPPPAPVAALPPAASTAPEPVRTPVPAAQGTPPSAMAGTATRPAAPVCTVCGRVESVQVVKRAAPATGVGAVAGGVLGGVVGNQFGHGSGRTAATVIGAVGGGYAGHTIEQRTRTETVYQVRVRMDSGALRTVETRTAPPIGKAVTLKGQVLRPADGRA